MQWQPLPASTQAKTKPPGYGKEAEGRIETELSKGSNVGNVGARGSQRHSTTPAWYLSRPDDTLSASPSPEIDPITRIDVPTSVSGTEVHRGLNVSVRLSWHFVPIDP